MNFLRLLPFYYALIMPLLRTGEAQEASKPDKWHLVS